MFDYLINYCCYLTNDRDKVDLTTLTINGCNIFAGID